MKTAKENQGAGSVDVDALLAAIGRSWKNECLQSLSGERCQREGEAKPHFSIICFMNVCCHAK